MKQLQMANTKKTTDTVVLRYTSWSSDKGKQYHETNKVNSLNYKTVAKCQHITMTNTGKHTMSLTP
jgi:hypothetical protein